MRLKSIIILFILFLSLYSQENWEKRDRWQKADEMIKAMKLSEGGIAADIGSKDGYLTIKLSKAVGDKGTVYAVDIDADALDDLQKNLNKREIINVKKILSKTNDPKLAMKSIDAAIILNAYHEMDEFPAMLSHIKAALKAGGRLVIIDGISESRRKSSRSIQTGKHELAMGLAINDLESAGFKIIETDEKFVTNHPWRDEQWILVAIPKQD